MQRIPLNGTIRNRRPMLLVRPSTLLSATNREPGSVPLTALGPPPSAYAPRDPPGPVRASLGAAGDPNNNGRSGHDPQDKDRALRG